MTGRVPWSRPEIALGSAAGGVASPTDIMGAAFDQMWFVDNTTAANDSLVEAYENIRRDVKTATGVDLGNPMIVPTEPSLVPNPLELIGRQYGQGDAIAQQRQIFEQKRSELAGQYPAEISGAWAQRDPVTEAQGIAKAADDRLGALMESRPGWDSFAYQFAGAAGAALRDPVTIGSLFLGGGPGGARTALGRVLQTAGTEAAVNAGTEAVMQPWVQSWRQQAGLDHGFDEAIKNIAFAGAFGGIFGGVARGAREALDFSRLAPEQRAGMAPELRGAIDAGNSLAVLETHRPIDIAPARHEQMLARAEAEMRGQPPAQPMALDDVQVNRIVESLAPARVDGMAQAPESFADTLVSIRAGDVDVQRTPRPVMEFIRSIGGVDPDGPMARELEGLGITNRDLPGLFKRGGHTDLDNVPMVEAGVAFPGRTDVDDGNGYISRQAFIDGLAAEKRSDGGRGATASEERAWWEARGVDFNADDAQILVRMAAVTDADARWLDAGAEARLETVDLVRQALSRAGGVAEDSVVREAVELVRGGDDIGDAVEWAMSMRAGVVRELPPRAPELEALGTIPPEPLHEWDDADFDWTREIDALRELDPELVGEIEAATRAEVSAWEAAAARQAEVVACPF